MSCILFVAHINFNAHSLVPLSLSQLMTKWKRFWNTVEMVNMDSKFQSLQLNRARKSQLISSTTSRLYLVRSISMASAGDHQIPYHSLVVEVQQWESCRSETHFLSFPYLQLLHTKTRARMQRLLAKSKSPQALCKACK